MDNIDNQEWNIALEADFWTDNSVIKHQEIGINNLKGSLAVYNMKNIKSKKDCKII